MKTLMKKWWFWVIVAIVLIIIISIIISLVITAKNLNGAETGGISKEEYRKIEVGKTNSYELNKIIDKNNEWSNEETYKKYVEKVEEKKENGRDTYVYKYYGEKGGYVLITLQANSLNEELNNNLIVTKKEEFDLK